MQGHLYDDGCQEELKVIKIKKGSPMKEIKICGKKKGVK